MSDTRQLDAGSGANGTQNTQIAGHGSAQGAGAPAASGEFKQAEVPPTGADRLPYVFRACQRVGRIHPLQDLVRQYRERGDA